MKWVRAIHRQTREVSYDSTPDSLNDRIYEIVPLKPNRPPSAVEEVQDDGTIVLNPALVRRAKWLEAKGTRERLEFGVAEIAFGGNQIAVQVDERSRLRINSLAVAALAAKALEAEFSEEFTLADNSTVTLDADGMLNLARQVAKWTRQLHENARALREKIEDTDRSMQGLNRLALHKGWPSVPLTPAERLTLNGSKHVHDGGCS